MMDRSERRALSRCCANVTLGGIATHDCENPPLTKPVLIGEIQVTTAVLFLVMAKRRSTVVGRAWSDFLARLKRSDQALRSRFLRNSNVVAENVRQSGSGCSSKLKTGVYLFRAGYDPLPLLTTALLLNLFK